MKHAKGGFCDTENPFPRPNKKPPKLAPLLYQAPQGMPDDAEIQASHETQRPENPEPAHSASAAGIFGLSPGRRLGERKDFPFRRNFLRRKKVAKKI